MSVRLYMDEQVDRQIAIQLRRRGVDVLTIQEDHHTGLDDAGVMDRADELDRIIFTRDDDFLREAAARLAAAESFSGVIYAHQMEVSLGRCVQDLEVLCLAGDSDDFADRVYFLPL